jgi:RNA polymerase sigma-B factor
MMAETRRGARARSESIDAWAIVRAALREDVETSQPQDWPVRSVRRAADRNPKIAHRGLARGSSITGLTAVGFELLVSGHVVSGYTYLVAEGSTRGPRLSVGPTKRRTRMSITSSALPQQDVARQERVLGRHDDPTITTDRLLWRWQAERDPHARDVLFERFLPLARRLAGRYYNPHEPLEDLVQVAGVALLGAIDRFDPDRGLPFQAFAIPTIIGELKRYFRDTGWTAHVPRGAKDLALRVDVAVRELTDSGGRPPGPAQIAEYLEIDLADVLAGLDAGTAHFSTSLDAPATTSDVPEPQSLGERFGRREDGYDLVDAKLSLAAAIPLLPHLERTVLLLRIERNLKQSEIAREIGCSQMQVSRLLRSAAEHLRQLLGS